MLMAAAFLMSTTGCAFVVGPRRVTSRGAALSSGGGSHECHPSQYWDGETCRHKGKGNGARKHDG